MNCELCGSKTDELIETNIEGAVIKVCKECSKLGKVLYKKESAQRGVSMNPEYMDKYDLIKKKKQDSNMFKNLIAYVEGYGRIIKNAREKMGLDQKEFARKFGIKESLIHAIESERMEPTDKMGKKLEEYLNIKIIENSNTGSDSIPFVSKDDANVMTIGNFLKVRKK